MPSNKTQTIPFVAKDLVVKIDGAPIEDSLRDKILEIVVDSNRHMPDMCTIKFFGDDTTLVDKKSMEIGKSLEVGIKVDGSSSVTMMKGEITAIEPEFQQASHVAFIIRAYDKSHRLYRGRKTRTFADQTDGDIAKKVAQEAGLTLQAGSTSTTYKHVWQNNQTDMEFLRARAALNGFQVYFDGEKLYFDAYKPASGAAVDLEWGQNLQEFTVRVKGTHQSDKVKVISWDSEKKQAVKGEATSATSTSDQGGESTDGGATAKKAFGGSAELTFVTYPGVAQGSAKAIAQAYYDELQGEYLNAEGRCLGNPKLKAGGKVNIKNVGSRFSGSYVLTSVTHIYSKDGYETIFSIHGRHSNALADLLINTQEGQDGHRLLINGVVPAIVTSNEDPDGYGRVKVKYPWLDDQFASFWARLCAPGAGATRGIFYIPEVNDEVLVAFEHGDINQPYILGGLWNKTDASPKKTSAAVASGKVNLRIIQSRSGHIITLDDTQGSEKITVVDKTGNHKITIDSAGKKITVENTDGDIEMLAKAGKFYVSAKEISMEASTTVSIKAKTNVTVEATSANTIKGMTVSVQGQTSTEVKGAQVSVNGSAMTEVKGGIVKIN